MKKVLVGTAIAASLLAVAVGPAARSVALATTPQATLTCRSGETMQALGLNWKCSSVNGTTALVATSSRSSTSGLSGDVGHCHPGDWITIGSLRLDCRKVGTQLTWAVLKRGPAVGRAEAAVLGRPKQVPGHCRTTSWLTLNSVRITCAIGKGPAAWTASGSSTSPEYVPTSEPTGNFAVQTMTQADINSEFRAWPGRWPQLAQWLQIDQARTVTETGFRIGFTESATAGWWADQVRWDLAFSTFSGSIPGNLTVSLWRKNDPGPPPSGFNLSNGFTLVGESAPVGPIPIGDNTVSFAKPVNLEPGTYVLVLAFRSDDPDVLMISVDGRQHGDNQIGADGQPNPCAYTPATDVYPQGAVYRSDPPYKTLVRGYQEPFSPVFVPVEGKVLSCAVIGKYTDIFNPGDIRVGFN